MLSFYIQQYFLFNRFICAQGIHDVMLKCHIYLYNIFIMLALLCMENPKAGWGGGMKEYIL